MERVSFDVKIRENIGKKELKAVRTAGNLAAIVYGLGDVLPIMLDEKTFFDVYRKKGENLIAELVIENDSKKFRSVMIKDIQWEPIKGKIKHIDFMEISLTEKITMTVPVETTGEAIGVKSDGGVLEHVAWEVEIECLPTNIPAKLVADVSELGINDNITVEGLPVPEGVVILSEKEMVVATVKPPITDEDLETTSTDVAEPEVITEKKDSETESNS